MANNFVMLIIILSTVAIIGYIAYSNQYTSKVQELAQQYVPQQVYRVFQTGDVMSMNINPNGPNSHTVTYVNTSTQSTTVTNSLQPNSSQTVASPSLNKTVIQNSTISAVSGKTYGQTGIYNQILPDDTYKMGADVIISGTIKQAIPNSCILSNGQTICQYVSPPLFDYLIDVTCKIPENNNCAMPDQVGKGTTDGAGGYSFTFHTSGIVDQVTAGQYLVKLSAVSQAVDSNNVPYTETLTKYIYLVN